MERARVVAAGWLVGLAGGALVWLAAPEASAGAIEAFGDVLARVAGQVPTPVLAGFVLLAGVVLWFVLLRYVLALAYRAWRRIAGRVAWALNLAFPDSPLVRFAAGTMVLVAAVLGIVGLLPVLTGDLGETDEGAARYVDRIAGGTLNTEWGAIVDGDAPRVEPACSGSRADGAGQADADGDGLPDAWERAGETPDGASLPDASPDRKDVYVHVNYGADVRALTDEEREDAREVWARMPVGNPDGSRGIRLHLDDESPGAGRLDAAAVFESPDGLDRYSTESRLGARQCVYHQVVFGEFEMGDRAGVAATPGYSVIVDGSRQPDYEGEVGFRVALVTHELLHNVAGPVDGQPHTESGWLAGGPDDEYLSDATARVLEDEGLFGPAA